MGEQQAPSRIANTKGEYPRPFGSSSDHSAPVDVEIVWPPAARWTIAALLFLAMLLIGWNSWLRSSGATRPSQLAGGDALSTKTVRGVMPEESARLFRVDLNEADHAQLLQIPGVGESLARKIEAYREAKGGFRDVSELANVSGIGSAILARLKPHVTVAGNGAEPAIEVQPRATGAVRKSVDPASPINMNSASLTELQRLPGVGPTIAARIVAAREVKPFKDIADLRRVSGIGPKTLEKLRSFVVFADGP